MAFPDIFMTSPELRNHLVKPASCSRYLKSSGDARLKEHGTTHFLSIDRAYPGEQEGKRWLGLGCSRCQKQQCREHMCMRSQKQSGDEPLMTSLNMSI